jgi:hypothetical protein
MIHNKTIVETRDVCDFNQVILRGDLCNAEFTIEQGERESLTIEAEPQVMRRLAASVRDRKLVIRLGGSWFERLTDRLENAFEPKLMLRLHLRELRSLDLACVSHVRAPSIETDSLRIRQSGAGHLFIESLKAQNLEIEQTNAGLIEIVGQVKKQRLRLSGVGRYDGSRLKTEHMEIRVTGSSYARVHVTNTLQAVVKGVGVIEYIGNPQVRTRMTGMGSVARV